MGPALRRREICVAIIAGLIGVITFAAAVPLLLLASMRSDVVSVFFRALVLSGMLSILPLSLLWLLERRERQAPWLFAAAFLWGGCIATGLALPFNSAFLKLADTWVVQHPVVREVLGPDAAMLLAAPISAPIVEEIAKAVGVLAIFRLLRPEFHNVRDGIVYGALVGVGFNWFEAALYVAQVYAETGAPPYGLQLGSRYALLGLGGHPISHPHLPRLPRHRRAHAARLHPHPRADRRARSGDCGAHGQQRPAAPRGARGRRGGRAAARLPCARPAGCAGPRRPLFARARALPAVPPAHGAGVVAKHPAR